MTAKRITKPSFKPTDDERNLVEQMTACGIPQESQCLVIRDGIDDKTLRKHFRRELDTAATKANTKVAGTLFSKAMGGDTAAMIWWSKTRMGWTWTVQPEKRFLFASYAASLSVRDSVKCRRLITSPWYQEHFGGGYNLTGDQNQKQRFENDKTGQRIATSVDGALTGEGGDIIVIDDPHNVREAESSIVLDWWDQAMQTRLNDPKTGAFIIIMQRVHEKDLTGHILANEHSDWDHLCLPARYEIGHPTPTQSRLYFTDPRTQEGELLWPNRVDENTLTKLEKSLGTYA